MAAAPRSEGPNIATHVIVPNAGAAATAHAQNVLFPPPPPPPPPPPSYLPQASQQQSNIYSQPQVPQTQYQPQQQQPLQFYYATPTFQGSASPINATAMAQPTEIQVDWRIAFSSGGFDGEPPLLDELGINFAHIRAKTFAVLNPLRPISTRIMDDADLAGPLLFCFLFGCLLLVAGKPHFPYIYGVATMGCVSMYALLNLMSESGINWAATASVLGYCLLPIVLLSLVGTVINLSTVSIGLALAAVAVLWCSHSASSMFSAVLQIHDQRPLIAYPVVLLYTIFGLMAVF